MKILFLKDYGKLGKKGETKSVDDKMYNFYMFLKNRGFVKILEKEVEKKEEIKEDSKEKTTTKKRTSKRKKS